MDQNLLTSSESFLTAKVSRALNNFHSSFKMSIFYPSSTENKSLKAELSPLLLITFEIFIKKCNVIYKQTKCKLINIFSAFENKASENKINIFIYPKKIAFKNFLVYCLKLNLLFISAQT